MYLSKILRNNIVLFLETDDSGDISFGVTLKLNKQHKGFEIHMLMFKFGIIKNGE